MPKRWPWSHTWSAHPLTSASITSGRAFVARSNSGPSARGAAEEGVAHRASHEEALVPGIDEPARDLLHRRRGIEQRPETLGHGGHRAILAPGPRPRRIPFAAGHPCHVCPPSEEPLRYRRRDGDAVLAGRVWRTRGRVVLLRRPRRARVARPARSRTRRRRRRALRPSRRHAHAARGAGTSRTAVPGPRASGSTARPPAPPFRASRARAGGGASGDQRRRHRPARRAAPPPADPLPFGPSPLAAMPSRLTVRARSRLTRSGTEPAHRSGTEPADVDDLLERRSPRCAGTLAAAGSVPERLAASVSVRLAGPACRRGSDAAATTARRNPGCRAGRDAGRAPPNRAGGTRRRGSGRAR